MPIFTSRSPIFATAAPEPTGWVMRVWIKPNATQLTFTLAAPFLGHGLGHADNGSLSGGIAHLAGVAVDAGDGGDIHHFAVDAAAFVLFFLGCAADKIRSGAQDAEGRGGVHVEHGVPLLVGHFLDDSVPGVAGIVDDDVDAAELVQCGLDDTRAEIRRRHVAEATDGVAAECLYFGDGFLRRA